MTANGKKDRDYEKEETQISKETELARKAGEGGE